ncbi:glycosyltransferase family 39 protein [Phaffia rhodozyma]|uniref:Dolichyl-phosphate-mannose--protein mannosyltransferase n=1 Tax=Phaffia rhodozyma TaxID=264483 RepID=A0A0F7SML7_PHARH|nr:glycosyltransferase family 39 protein [Phaffia rhodozyma]
MASKPSPFFPPPPPPPNRIHEADARLLQPRSRDHYDSPSAYLKPSSSSLAGAKFGSQIKRKEWFLVASVVALSLVVRLWNIWEPSSVVFDEVHFGGFASKYIRHTFFMDVHPPLAKLLITFAAWLGGYQGGVDDFKDIAKEYDASVPYVMMRLLPGLLGVSLVPLTYLTLRSLSCTTTTSLLGSSLVLFDNALVAQSRLILLDSPLIFFTATTIFSYCRFSNEDAHAPFQRSWWRWLLSTGLNLGFVASCKWVGLFTIATVGFSTVIQLWTLLGDIKVKPRMWARHFVARLAGLVMVPILVYMFTFRVHFWLLHSSGEGDGFMSSEFQHTLRGHGMADTFAEVAYGSTVSIRHYNTQGGYLHSHPHNYPSGSQQQQITLYPHKDDNNDWLIVNTTHSVQEGPIKYVKDGDQVKLLHKGTEKRLHSHDVRPPISEVDFQQEVSGYGFEGFEGDANDIFIFELSHSPNKSARKQLRTLRSHFRLRHMLTGCYLFSHKVKLPEWGFEQQEVTCNKNPSLDNSLWYIETNENPLLPSGADRVNYERPGFLSKFLELQAVMWRTNAGLTDRHAYDSRPTSWPFMRRGINFWVKDHRQIYLIGNPFVWWGSTFAVLTYMAFRGLLILRAKRGFRDLHHPLIVRYDSTLAFLLGGWFLHYFPFYLMQRQLFLHHYLPALWFSILLLCVLFDMATSKIRPKSRLAIALVIVIITLVGFRRYSPLSYGSPWTKTKCETGKWRKSWDFSCADFHDSLSDYDITTSKPLTSPLFPEPIESQSTTAGSLNVKIEPGPNVFDPKVDANPAVAADAQGQQILEKGRDEGVPVHGGADDLATGSPDDEDPSPTLVPTVIQERQAEALAREEEKKRREEKLEASIGLKAAEEPLIPFKDLEGEEKVEAEQLVAEALENDQKEEEEAVAEAEAEAAEIEAAV